MLGGALVGVFAFFMPEAMATGYGTVQEALTGQMATWSHFCSTVAILQRC